MNHLDEAGRARMVDVGGKGVTQRLARACARVTMAPETFRLLQDQQVPKGDVEAVARLAAIMAAKKTPDLIPLCHPLPLDGVTVEIRRQPPDGLEIEATVRCTGRTGVEMEALTAVSIASLAVYDMLKGVDKSLVIGPIHLLEKTKQ